MENLTVKMSNVRTVVSFTGNTLNFRFLQAPEKGVKLDTKQAEQFASRSYDCTELPEEIFIPCEGARHGIKQKMGDALAMNKEARTATSLDEAVKTLDTLFAQLKENKWRSAVRVAAESIKLNDLEKSFHDSISKGITTYEQAFALYRTITGKELPRPVEPAEESETEEVVDNEK